MTDLKRHSKGYWRSFYIFSPIEKQYQIRDTIESELERIGVEYSYCYYSEVKRVDPRRNEEAHITFRVNFSDLKTYEEFLKFLKKQKWKWEDHNYDEPLWVKKGYVLGTKLYNETIKEVMKSPDIPFNSHFLRILFHGFFNNSHYSKKKELEVYYFLFDSMLREIYGISAVEER